MNEKINLVEILKDCPKGTKLYSPMLGEVELKEEITGDIDRYPIIVLKEIRGGVVEHHFSSDGKYYESFEDAECTLFPSKDQRDWSKFGCPKPKFDPKTLQPFDRILVRDNSAFDWNCDLFSHINYTKCFTISGCWYVQTIPYNEHTKHLVGTKNEAPEYYRYWED